MREHCWHFVPRPWRDSERLVEPLVCCHCGAGGERVTQAATEIPEGHGSHFPMHAEMSVATQAHDRSVTCEEYNGDAK